MVCHAIHRDRMGRVRSTRQWVGDFKEVVTVKSIRGQPPRRDVVFIERGKEGVIHYFGEFMTEHRDILNSARGQKNPGADPAYKGRNISFILGHKVIGMET